MKSELEIKRDLKDLTVTFLETCSAVVALKTIIPVFQYSITPACFFIS